MLSKSAGLRVIRVCEPKVLQEATIDVEPNFIGDAFIHQWMAANDDNDDE